MDPMIPEKAIVVESGKVLKTSSPLKKESVWLKMVRVAATSWAVPSVRAMVISPAHTEFRILGG